MNFIVMYFSEPRTKQKPPIKKKRELRRQRIKETENRIHMFRVSAFKYGDLRAGVGTIIED